MLPLRLGCGYRIGKWCICAFDEARWLKIRIMLEFFYMDSIKMAMVGTFGVFVGCVSSLSR
jgi:hypothetical protein